MYFVFWGFYKRDLRISTAGKKDIIFHIIDQVKLLRVNPVLPSFNGKSLENSLTVPLTQISDWEKYGQSWKMKEKLKKEKTVTATTKNTNIVFLFHIGFIETIVVELIK